MKIVCVVQARLNSTRLPRKILLPLAGKPMLLNMLERIQRSKRIDAIVVTCPAEDAIEISKGTPKKTMIDAWLADENDLVARHLSAALSVYADIIVRIPSDNPLVDHEYIDAAVEDYIERPYIFFSNTTDLIKHDGRQLWADGIGAEVLSMSRLKWLDRITQGERELREHPHKYFLDRYRDNDIPDEGICFGKLEADLRLDVNTQYDYEFVSNIYGYFGHNHFTAQDILACPPVQERLNGR